VPPGSRGDLGRERGVEGTRGELMVYSPVKSPRVAAIGRIEPAELLYGRLLASVAGGAEPGHAQVRLADGRAQKLPLARWLAPVDAAAAFAVDGRWFVRLERVP
jgi:hypothetical protein